jgi:alkane 1-monooxygenase
MARMYLNADGVPVAWRDSKRHLWMLGLVIPVSPLVGLALYQSTGMGFWLWLTPVMFLGIIPICDLFSGYDASNPPEEIVESLDKDKYYRWVTYLYIPVQYIGFILSMYFLATNADLTTGNRVALAISVGIVAGVAINTAHELGHKREEVERWASKIALAQSFYGHFFIEHNRGHHVRVATPPDPASARMGESLYRFWPRTVIGSLKSAWELEKSRYQRKGQHPFRIGNHVLNAWLMSVVLWGGLMLALFATGVETHVAPLEFLGYLILQGVVGFSLLEIVNYMEHYGMLRQLVGPVGKQRFERVTPAHSWNSNNIATNVLLYHLQRHSDHHANPTRRYQALRDFKEAPVLPTGYTGMIVVALFPFWFRALMDKRVYDHYDGDLTLANLAPHKREKLLKKWPLKEHAALDHSVDPTVQHFAGVVEAARCPGCGYTYSVETGDESEGFAPGTAWATIPDHWCCPDCGVREKVDFVPLTKQEV